MGGGGTIAEGFRRLFQRRAPHHSKENDDDRIFVRDLRAQLAIIPTNDQDQYQDQDQDRDQPLPLQSHFSLLNNIKVPTFPPFSMDPPHKKVPSFPTFLTVIRVT